MVSDRECVQAEIEKLSSSGDDNGCQVGYFDAKILRTLSSSNPFLKKSSLRRLNQLFILQLDHKIWAAALRCWTLHSKLVKEYETGVETENSAAIEILAAVRRQAFADLANMRSSGLCGIVLKKHILLLVAGGYDEIALLLRSCISDCDLVIGSQCDGNLINTEPDLATIVALFFQTINQLDEGLGVYSELDDENREADKSERFSKIPNLIQHLEAAISAIAKHPAATVAGFNAKLKIFEMSDGWRGAGRALLSLKFSLFRDLDRLLQQHAKNTRSADPVKKSVFRLTSRGLRAVRS